MFSKGIVNQLDSESFNLQSFSWLAIMRIVRVEGIGYILNILHHYIVYWSRLHSHTDINTEGYVGISSRSLDERKKSHYKAAKSKKTKNLHFHNALNKYNDSVVWEIVHASLSRERAFQLENDYRPRINIGWNSDAGGYVAISPDWYQDEENKANHRALTSEATKLKIAEKDSPEERSKRAKNVWANEEYRQSRKGEISGDKNPQYGKFGLDHPATGHKKSEASKKSISDAHKGKKLSQDTKDKISIARVNKFALQKAERLAREKEDRELKSQQREVERVAGKFKGGAARAAKVTDVQRCEICDRRLGGETYKAIAADYQLTLTGVRAVCQMWGPLNGYEFTAQIGKSSLKKVTSALDKTAICKAYYEGESATVLANKYLLSEGTVYRFLSDWGPQHGIEFIHQKGKGKS